jgi:hypothetical protein
MGVFTDVYICVRADAPCPIDARCALIELCLEHRLLVGHCFVNVASETAEKSGPNAGKPPSGLWDRLRSLFAPSSLPPAARRVSSLVEASLAPYGGVRGPGIRVVDDGAAAPWIAERVRRLSASFSVTCESPIWAGAPQDGGFSYLASNHAFDVRVSNAYEARGGRRSPHGGEDGWVGAFFDVMVLSSRAAPDGRKIASSAFVKDLKKRTGLQVTCRASHW